MGAGFSLTDRPMHFPRPLIPLAIAFLLVQCKSGAPSYGPADSGGAAAEASYHDDWARFLAGLPGGRNSAFAGSRQTAAWQQHQAEMDRLFSNFGNTRQLSIGGWQSGELGHLGSRFVFYPFGGPDFLFSHTLFPGASTHVLVGLEGVAPLPAPALVLENNLAGNLGNLRKSLGSAVNFSYFITKDMRAELSATRLEGTLPVLLVFLARTGHRVQSVELISLSGAGQVVPRGAGSAPGFRIVANGGSKVVYYFQENLGNENLASNPRILRFVSSQGSPVTFLKSASYLMHQDRFSVIRNAILNQSQAVVSDPSGVPFRYFDPARWNITLYGDYTGPIPLFSEYPQTDLAAAYRDGRYKVKPLPFGVGYTQKALFVAKRTGP